MTRLIRAGMIGLLALCGAATSASGEAVVADLSKRLVAITTGFAGTDVLLFGAIEGEEGGEVVVVVRGPIQRTTVRRKSRVAGVWINNDLMVFDNVPAFYAVSASASLETLVPDSVARVAGIGARNLDIRVAADGGQRDKAPRCPDALAPATGSGGTIPAMLRLGEYCAALIRNKRRAGLFIKGGEVIFLPGRRLFRTTVRFPANVPVGRYTVLVYVVRKGQIVASQSNALVINKIGMEAEVFDFAHERPALYGLIAVALALMAGWGAGQIFRRR